MDQRSFSLHQMRLQAFDLSERTAKRGGRSVKKRVQRWWDRLFMIFQCAITAGLAWWLAQTLLGHKQPFFAPVAAIITLGFSFGQRLSRATEVAIGVAVGVFIGDVFVRFFGTGVWQIIVVCLIAMSVATLLGARNLMVTQAGVQAIIVITLLPAPNMGLNRWLDAAIGCAIALLVATMAPSGPLRRPRILAAEVLGDMAVTLEAAQAALRTGDAEGTDAVLHRARNSEEQLEDLDEAATEGLAVVRYSPFRLRQLGPVQAYADLAVPLDRLARNLRVLARRSAVALWREEPVPLSYLVMMGSLAEILGFMSSELQERRLPTAARDRIVKLGRDSSQLKLPNSLSSVVILAQMRSMLVDLLQLCGLDSAEARELIPDME